MISPLECSRAILSSVFVQFIALASASFCVVVIISCWTCFLVGFARGEVTSYRACASRVLNSISTDQTEQGRPEGLTMLR